MSDYKTCTKCGATKPVSEFSKNRSKKDGLQASCKACFKAYNSAYREANGEKIAAVRRAYREANREKRAAYQRAWREANQQKRAAYNRAYREANQEKEAAYNRAWKQANREKEAARVLAWRRANPEKKAAWQRAWREANREKRAAYKHRRRALKAGNGEHLILEKELRRLYDSPCVACGATENMQLDHVIPIEKGGRTSIGNSQPLCRSCNASKGDKLMIEWRVWRDKLARLSVGAA